MQSSFSISPSFLVFLSFSPSLIPLMTFGIESLLERMLMSSSLYFCSISAPDASSCEYASPSSFEILSSLRPNSLIYSEILLKNPISSPLSSFCSSESMALSFLFSSSKVWISYFLNGFSESSISSVSMVISCSFSFSSRRSTFSFYALQFLSLF